MHVTVSELAGDHNLATATAGQQLFSQVARHLTPSHPPSEPRLLLLDFADVTFASGSFLRAFLISLRDYCRTPTINAFPLIANPSDQVAQEIDDLLGPVRDVLVTCHLDPDHRPVDARVRGFLDEKHRTTLHAVVTAGETDAPSLAQAASNDARVGTTAWNNRLVTLTSKGLLIETRVGRTKRYRPVLEGLSCGP